MRRRAFLAAMLAGALAPASVRAAPWALESTQAMVLAQEVKSIVHLVQQLEFMARQVSGLRFETVGDLLRTMNMVRGMLGSINPAIQRAGLGDAIFRRCWPQEYGLGTTRRALVGKIDEWRAMSEATIQESWRVEAAAMAELPAVALRTARLVEASQSSPGALSAIQAGNQILGTLVGQMMSMQATAVTHQRSVETVLAGRQNDAARQRAVGEDAVKDSPGWQRLKQMQSDRGG